MIKATKVTGFAVLLSSLLISQNAFAHSPIKGIGFLFNGILHPFFIPSHILLILTLGFYLGQETGQHKPQKHVVPVLFFLGTMIATFTLIAFYPQVTQLLEQKVAYNSSMVLLVLAILTGLLTLSTLRLATPVISLLCILIALALGLDSQVEDLSGSAKVIALVGNVVGSYLMLLYAMALSETLSVKKWQQITIRILTSWLSAGAVMVLALNLSH